MYPKNIDLAANIRFITGQMSLKMIDLAAINKTYYGQIYFPKKAEEFLTLAMMKAKWIS